MRSAPTSPVSATCFAAALLAAALSTACGSVPRPRSAATSAADGNPLGPSYVLLPLPTEDDSLLGRVLPVAPEPGRSLEETARANPCAEHLSEPRETPLASHFSYAEELSAGARAGAVLGAFGFSADARRATHFVYDLKTDKRLGRVDTAAYDACCAERGCGYGYVSALIHGDGSYATGEEGRALGSVEVPLVASASGEVALSILQKRQVRGYVAALITVTDRAQGDALGPLGVARAAGITEATAPEMVRRLYERERVSVTTEGSSWAFVQGLPDEKLDGAKLNKSVWTTGVIDWYSSDDPTLTEAEFARRFEHVTGSDELADLTGRRNTPELVILSASAALGAGAAALGVGLIVHENEVQAGNFTALVLGVAGLFGFGVPALMVALHPDGTITNHQLTERDARLYAERYNRALLRGLARDVEQNQRESRREAPVLTIGLRPFGLSGSF